MIYILLGSVCFLSGACVGTRDCKRKFGIPKNAIAVDDNGVYIVR